MATLYRLAHQATVQAAKMKLEKENSFRTLKGQDPIQRLRCRLGWHRWTAWDYQDYSHNTGLGGYATCYCADCGMPRQERPYTKRKKD